MSDFTRFAEGLWGNAPLVAALAAIIVTQLLKIPLGYLNDRVWNLHKMIDAGGMPSSHSAGVMALTTALGYVVGPKSPIFATAVVFTAIVMYDAGGIRRHAGEHAVLLNRLAMEISQTDDSIAPATNVEGERLKEILGHEPKEVLIGGLIGAIIGAGFGKWW